MTDKPTIKPNSPLFSSGPCSKPPGWSLDELKGAVLGRSHRSKIGKAKLHSVITETREVLDIPDDYKLAIVSASDTGAVEMAMWSLLGERGVEVYAWENFGNDWCVDVCSQLPLEDKLVTVADYGNLPDFSKSNSDNDIIFTWNGTTSGVRVKDASWIKDDRKGLTICDATSAIFSMKLDWPKLDVTTWSWQKVLGSEAAHGMIALSPRAIKRLESYTPSWPIPKIFRLATNKKVNEGIFSGETINTPSLLCAEDVLYSLRWAKSIGGMSELIKISENNLKLVEEWIATNDYFDFLPVDPETRSCTSICIVPKEEWYKNLDKDTKKIFMGHIYSILEENDVAYDINSYKTAPLGIRIWGGSTVQNENVKLLLPWIDWAYEQSKLKV